MARVTVYGLENRRRSALVRRKKDVIKYSNTLNTAESEHLWDNAVAKLKRAKTDILNIEAKLT